MFILLIEDHLSILIKPKNYTIVNLGYGLLFFYLEREKKKSTAHPCFKLEIENMKQYLPTALQFYIRANLRVGDRNGTERERKRKSQNWDLPALRGSDSCS